MRLVNIHGDVVASVPNNVPTAANPAGSTISAYSEATEFGLQRSPNAERYGWLGQMGKEASSVGGLVFMGDRLYNPATGSFLTRDPVTGGNLNDYVYPTNPLDESDLDGRCSCAEYSTRLVIGRFAKPHQAVTETGLKREVGDEVASLLLGLLALAAACAYAWWLHCDGGFGRIKRPQDKDNGLLYVIYEIDYEKNGEIDVFKFGISVQYRAEERKRKGRSKCRQWMGPAAVCTSETLVDNIPGKLAARAGEFALIGGYYLLVGRCPIGNYDKAGYCK